MLETGEALFGELGAELVSLNPHEPYRRAFTFMRNGPRDPRRRAGSYAGPPSCWPTCGRRAALGPAAGRSRPQATSAT